MNEMKRALIASENTLLRNSDRSSIGSDTRISQTMNATTVTTAAIGPQDNRRGRPSELPPVGHSQQERDQGGGGERGANPVERASARAGGLLFRSALEHEGGGGHGQNSYGYPREEDPSPPELGDQQAADYRAGDSARPYYRHIQAHRLSSLFRGEDLGYECHAVRLNARGAYSLYYLDRYQEGQTLREAAHERHNDEGDVAHEIDSLAAYHVRQAAHGHEHRAGGQAVTERYPLDGRNVGGEVVGYFGQRDVDSRLVHNRQEHSDCDRPIGPPLVVGAGGDAAQRPDSE